MKASIILTAIFLFISSLSWCQSSIEKGTISLNGNISFTSNYEEDADLNSTIFIFNPRFDYFIIDNLSLGIMLNYQNTSFGAEIIPVGELVLRQDIILMFKSLNHLWE